MTALLLFVLASLPANAAGADSASTGDLVPGGWLQAPRVPPAPPPAAANPPLASDPGLPAPVPSAAPVHPPRHRVTRPAMHPLPRPAPPTPGRVQF